jgi:hypothetical protein
MAKKPKTIEHLDASIARWKTRLKRAVTMIDKLEKQRKRVAKAAAAPPRKLPEPVADQIAGYHRDQSEAERIKRGALPSKPEPMPEPKPERNLDIPAFLRRQTPDPVAEQIKAEQAETKKKKARGRIEKMKAKQSGDTKKMPLTGRAALDAIRNG